MTPLTSATARTGALDPALDAVAHNHEQARIIDHPDTPAPDSIVEHIDLAMRHMRHAMHLLGDLARSNGLELHCERKITEWGDDLVTTLHDLERNGDGPESGRNLAKRLKPLLDALEPAGHGPNLFDAVDARVELTLIFRESTEAVLLAQAVTHQLAPRRTRLLRAEYARWCERVGRKPSAVAA